MLDSYIRPLIDPPLNAVARVLVRQGMTGNKITLFGFLLGLCVFALLSLQYYTMAIIFIILSRLMDGLDGPVARQTGSSDLGGYLDIVSDFIFYSGTVFFFAVGKPDIALAAAFLIFSFMGTGSAFLAYAIFTAKRGINHEKQGKKSFFYLGGIAEGTESIATLVLICLLPDSFTLIAYVFGTLCWITTAGRVLQAIRTLKADTV